MIHPSNTFNFKLVSSSIQKLVNENEASIYYFVKLIQETIFLIIFFSNCFNLEIINLFFKI
jgi:hypothetical protein